jgi:hypothetical protein
MKLTGGQTFWAGYTSGRGKVYVAAVPLDDDYSNLPRHALFVPTLFQDSFVKRARSAFVLYPGAG